MSRGLLHEIVGEFVAEADGCFVGRTGESCLQGGDIFTLGLDAGFVILLLGRELFLEFGRNVHDFEEGVRPSRTAAFLVLCPRSGREVTAVNGEAARSVLILYGVAFVKDASYIHKCIFFT